jgi:hypothetical protein
VRIVVSGRAFAVAAALSVVFAARANAFDLEALFMRDVVYQPERDSVVQPAAAAIGVGFRFGPIGMVQARVGGSGYWNQVVYVDEEDGSNVREALRSAWVQVIPGVRVPLFYEPLAAYGGIGLGGRSSAERRIDQVPGYYNDYTKWHDRSVWAFDQSFTLGLGFELSRRFALDLEASRAGFTVGSEVIRRYTTHSDYEDPIEEECQSVLRAGWRKTAATGIGVGLRLKL